MNFLGQINEENQHDIYTSLTSVFSPQPDTSLDCETTDTVHRAVCLRVYMSQLSLVLIAPTHVGWPGCVDLGGWLYMKMVYLPTDSHPSRY